LGKGYSVSPSILVSPTAYHRLQEGDFVMLRSLTLFQLWTYLRAVCMRAMHALVILSLIMPNVTGLAEAASPVAAGPIRSHPQARLVHQTAQATGAEQPAASGTPVAEPVVAAQMETAFQSAPVMFIENVGQFDPHARFQVRGAGGTIFLAEDAIWVTLLEKPQPVDPATIDDPIAARHDNKPLRGVNLRLTLSGANPHPQIEGFNPLDTTVSYFIGNDPAQWKTDVPVYAGVRYKDIYPGVDLEITSENGQWTWRLVGKQPDALTPLSSRHPQGRGKHPAMGRA